MSDELTTVGNRINLVAGLLSVSEECEPCSQPYRRRMQSDLVELVEIACATGKAIYSEVQVSRSEQAGALQTVSKSEVTLKFLASVSTVHERGGVKLGYVKINSVSPTQCNVKIFYNSVKLYSFKSNIPHISAFIVAYPEVKAELKRSSTTTRFDLFAKVEDLTEETAQEEKEVALMFPCFSLTRQQNLHWLSGLSVLTEEEPWFVSSATDQVEATCFSNKPCRGGLLTRRSKCEIIEQEFVFGI
jgi:hypothetical protein